ncbi:MAG TPA: heat shock protein HspQ [Gammaproteobacteria bacterium]|nr:heat shock protein HspQ [Gammaproteobacteria bacterium]
MNSRPNFSIGQVVHHVKYDYRGVIVDVDPVFSGTEEWYEFMARSRPPKGAPWYHVLVDGADHSTYVAEQHLEADDTGAQITHPALGRYFDLFVNGRYLSRRQSH